VPDPDSAGALCREARGDCEVDAVCTGNSILCPDSFKESGTVCRPAEGDCDVAEVCTGDSPQCPPDRLRGSGFECRAPQNQCQDAATCSGSSATCPANPVRVGQGCDDSNPCTTGDVCLADGTCRGTPLPNNPVVCGTICCTGNQGFCCPPGTRRAGECRANLNACG
jgi:hypothetical protein